MKKIVLTLGVAILFITAGGHSYSQIARPTPTPASYRSLEEANRRIQELEAENETLQIQQENDQLRRMEQQYDSAHPSWYGCPCPYYVPVPCYGGWGGFHHHYYPVDVHHHHYHHHHHH